MVDRRFLAFTSKCALYLGVNDQRLQAIVRHGEQYQLSSMSAVSNGKWISDDSQWLQPNT